MGGTLIKILDLKFSSYSDSIQRSFFHYEPMEAMEHVFCKGGILTSKYVHERCIGTRQI